MESCTSVAAELARRAHEFGLDKGGDPYINHVERVATRLANFDDEVRAAAWLHDVCECGGLTLEDLSANGMPDSVSAAVDALTRRQEEEVETYLQRVLETTVSATVKRSDLADNSREDRLAKLPQATRERLIEKYLKYSRVLGSFSTAVVTDLLPTQPEDMPSIAWAESEDCDPLMIYHCFALPIAQAALSQTAEAAEAEPAITAALRLVMPPEGSLQGLEHRLKSPSHLADKLRRSVLGGRNLSAQDQVRYTLVLPHDNLVQLANDVFEDLRVRGWQCVELTHRYYAGAPYKGVHALLLTYGASARVVELQLHTPAAMQAKKDSRAYFEMSQQRPGTEGRLSNDEIQRHRIEIWRGVPKPPGLEELHFGSRRVQLQRG